MNRPIDPDDAETYIDYLEEKEAQLRERLADAEARETDLRDEVFRLKTLALDMAAVFRRYETLHRAKPGADEVGCERWVKAEENAALALRCEEAAR